jgi:hypothetical protein
MLHVKQSTSPHETRERVPCSFCCNISTRNTLGNYARGPSINRVCVRRYVFAAELTISHKRKTFANPITAWDCETKEEVLLQAYALLFAGDNPMQAELCSCAGLNSNYFCRSCKAGGTQDYKKSPQGFAEMLRVRNGYTFCSLSMRVLI